MMYAGILREHFQDSPSLLMTRIASLKHSNYWHQGAMRSPPRFLKCTGVLGWQSQGPWVNYRSSLMFFVTLICNSPKKDAERCETRMEVFDDVSSIFSSFPTLRHFFGSCYTFDTHDLQSTKKKWDHHRLLTHPLIECLNFLFARWFSWNSHMFQITLR